MSVKTEIQDQKFRDWKKDIDRRCAEHLANHPEQPKKEPQKQLPASTSLKVSVLESSITPGVWSVYRGLNRLVTFYSQNAQQQATKFAGELLNG